LGWDFGSNSVAATVSESVTLAGHGLSVVLSRIGDRYRHEVLITTDQARVMLASLEGTSDQAWPPSPPFQELHTHQSNGSIDAVLLIGRAGRGHWSASIEVDHSQEAVLFDIACRSSGPIDWLGNRYRCPVGQAGATVAQPRVLLVGSDLQLHVLEGEACVSEEDRMQVLSIAPVWTASSRSQTIRWKYRISRAGSCAVGD
jgi:hypothetical protein